MSAIPEPIAPSAASPQLLATVRNRIFDEIAVGDTDAIERTLSKEDIELFAILSGDVNPQHLDADFAASTSFQGVVAHGMLGGSLISAVLGNRLPGPGTIYLAQTLDFLAPVRIGDRLHVSVTVTARDEARQRLTLACRCVNQHGTTVVSGQAQVQALELRVFPHQLGLLGDLDASDHLLLDEQCAPDVAQEPGNAAPRPAPRR